MKTRRAGSRVRLTPPTHAVDEIEDQSKPPAAGSLGEFLAFGPLVLRAALTVRLRELLAALKAPGGEGSVEGMAVALDGAVESGGHAAVWLALAVLMARLPDTPTVLRVARAARLDGPGLALLAELSAMSPSDFDVPVGVDVVTGAVLVDVDHTVRTSLSTGIQRVARETIRRWTRDHEVMLSGWTDGYTALRRLTAEETHRVLASPDRSEPTGPIPRRVIVPWKCVLVVPELGADPPRTARLQALASFSGTTTGLIGFDCVPIMAAETSAEGMSSAFAGYLGAASHVDRIAAISETAAVEYKGWRAMLAGAGMAGPDVTAISLPVEGRTPSEDAILEAKDLIGLGPLRIVLAVGSHEPRKNHLAVLQAAEVLWNEGLSFALTFVGGNSWNSQRFAERVQALQKANRPVQTIRALPDATLWAAYGLAFCTVFPSLHEGFGLPVAESLASGTPVITSNFGSMKEIADHGGALLVDPRSDDELTAALRKLLTDGDLRPRLARQALQLPKRSWDEYAAEVWAYLVEGVEPSAMAST